MIWFCHFVFDISDDSSPVVSYLALPDSCHFRTSYFLPFAYCISLAYLVSLLSFASFASPVFHILYLFHLFVAFLVASVSLDFRVLLHSFLAFSKYLAPVISNVICICCFLVALVSHGFRGSSRLFLALGSHSRLPAFPTLGSHHSPAFSINFSNMASSADANLTIIWFPYCFSLINE
jgi:hypothetical protein